MTVTVNRKQLNEAMSSAMRCIEARSAQPILQCVKLAFALDTLTLTTTNLDKTMVTSIPVTGLRDEFNICVNGRLLTNVAAKLSDDEIVIDAGEKSFIIKSKSGDITLAVTDADRFPDVVVPDRLASFISFSIDNFTNVLRSVLCGTSEEESLMRRDLAEITTETNLIESRFVCVSTDMKRLAVVKGSCEKSDETDKSPIVLQLPIHAVRALLPICVASSEKDIKLSQDGNHIFVILNETLEFSFRKVIAQMPSFQSFLNQFEIYATVNPEPDSMIKALDTVSLFVDDRSRSFNMNISGYEMELSAASSDVGNIKQVVDINEQSNEFDAVFDVTYIVPILKQFGDDITMEFQKSVITRKDEVVISYPLRITPKVGGLEMNFYIQPRSF